VYQSLNVDEPVLYIYENGNVSVGFVVVILKSVIYDEVTDVSLIPSYHIRSNAPAGIIEPVNETPLWVTTVAISL